jgi:hypothetical protein
MDVSTLGRPLSSVVRWLFDVFGQKVFVFVEVSFNKGHGKPYCLKVVNLSKYEVLIEQLHVTPDGFPEDGNGWHLSESKIFQNKILKPSQSIKMYLETKDIDKQPDRSFHITYKTKLFKWFIPRKQESCKHSFNVKEQMISEVSSIRIG